MALSQTVFAAKVNYQWIPDGRRPRELPEKCSAQRVEKIIFNFQNPAQRNEKLNSYFKECEEYHTFMGSTGIPAIMELANAEYEYFEVPYIKPVTLSMKDGAKLHAVLALKPGNKPRPLVISQCGLTCNTLNSSSVRDPLMHLFDESPFHVLLVGSSTTAEFGLSNGRLFVGGLQEGQYLVDVAKWVSENFSQQVSSIHVHGASLGGHAAFFSSVYGPQQGQRFIRSVQAHCPVTELEASIDYILRPEKEARFIQQKIWLQLVEMLGKVKIVDRLIPDGKKPSSERLKEIVSAASLDYWNGSNIFGFPKTPNEYWQTNSFLRVASEAQVPILAWGAADDPVVKSSQNSYRLREATKNAVVIETPTGSHCAFSVSHGSDVATAVLASFVKINSPEFLASYGERETILGDLFKTLSLKDTERHFSQKFSVQPNEDYFSAEFQFFDEEKKECRNADPFLVSEDLNCFTVQTVKVPLTRLKLPSFLNNISNYPTAQMATRWMNINFHVVDTRGETINNSRSQPEKIIWKEIE